MKLAKIVIGAVVLTVLTTIAFALLFERVPPTMIGVKQVQWSGGGIVEADYGTGFHLGISGYHKWYLLDRRTHFLTYSDGRMDEDGHDARSALRITTNDNNQLTIDMTVTYRIKPDEGHLLVQDSLRGIYRDQVAKTVEDVMRAELAQLTSEDFYSTEVRLAVLPVVSA